MVKPEITEVMVLHLINKEEEFMQLTGILMTISKSGSSQETKFQETFIIINQIQQTGENNKLISELDLTLNVPLIISNLKLSLLI